MPDWFVNLTYITLATGMVVFLGCIAAVIATVVTAAIREYLKERKDAEKKKNREDANGRNSTVG